MRRCPRSLLSCRAGKSHLGHERLEHGKAFGGHPVRGLDTQMYDRLSVRCRWRINCGSVPSGPISDSGAAPCPAAATMGDPVTVSVITGLILLNPGELGQPCAYLARLLSEWSGSPGGQPEVAWGLQCPINSADSFWCMLTVLCHVSSRMRSVATGHGAAAVSDLQA